MPSRSSGTNSRGERRFLPSTRSPPRSSVTLSIRTVPRTMGRIFSCEPSRRHQWIGRDSARLVAGRGASSATCQRFATTSHGPLRHRVPSNFKARLAWPNGHFFCAKWPDTEAPSEMLKPGRMFERPFEMFERAAGCSNGGILKAISKRAPVMATWSRSQPCGWRRGWWLRCRRTPSTTTRSRFPWPR